MPRTRITIRRAQFACIAIARCLTVISAIPVNAELAQLSPPIEQRTIEEVVVVGTLIKSETVHEGRAPIQTLDASSFEAVGASQPVDILASLTANTGSYLASEQNYLQGVSQFSLRGVGLSSTLTLINGRRGGFSPISNDVGQSFFDINSLPVLLIERVEILRDGASSTYGSQAVAGVANIVTRKSFSGLEIVAGYRSSSNSVWDLGFASGIETGRGNIRLFGSWLEQDENFRSEFEWLRSRAIDPNGDGDIVDGSFDSGRGSPGSFRRVVINPNGSYSPFQIDGIPTPLHPDPDCQAGGGYPSGLLCRVDFTDQRTTIAAEKRGQLFFEGEFHASDRMTIFSEVGFSSNEVTDRVGNMPLFNGNVVGTNEIYVPANHPFNFWTDPNNDGYLEYIDPATWDPIEHEAVPLGYFGRPLGAEAFGENAGVDRRLFSNLRLLIGIEMDLPGGWTGTGHITRARSQLDVRADRHWIATEFASALLDGSWNPFGTRLVAPGLITPKTVTHDNLNPARSGQLAGNTVEALSRFEGTRLESAEGIQNVIELIVNSDSYSVGNSLINVAAGLQHRTIDHEFNPDPLDVAGEGPRDVRQFPAESEQSTWAVFGESVIDFGDRFSLQLAARHESYDLAGSSTDPKIAAHLVLSDWLSVRTSWGTSFQAPSVFQATGNTSSRTLTDAFQFDNQGVGGCSIDATGSIRDRGDNFSAVTVLRGGGLGPQTARSANIGMLVKPYNDAQVSLDYWTLDYRDVIAQGDSFQEIVDDDCRDDGRPNDPRVHRDSSGQINSVTTHYENIGAVHSSGLDLNSFYDLFLEHSDVRFTVDATYLTQFDVSATGVRFIDRLGNRNNTNGFAPTPKLRLNLGVGWNRGSHSTSVTLRYIDSYKNDEIASWPEISAWSTIDVNYSYEIKESFGGDTRLFLGIRNLTDEDPPPLPNGQSSVYQYNLRPGFDGFVHDIKGRTMYVRIRVRL